MKQLNKLILLLFLAGFYAPVFAAVQGVDLGTCSVYSEEEKKDGDKKTEEEPDCE